MTGQQPDPPGTRSIRLEVEVPGTPEEVWEAIATGPGITSWFVPATVEGRSGGTLTMSFGPGYDQSGTVTAWEPPNRFAYSTEDPRGRLACEWLVEARDGGTCVVRLINSGFGTDEGWDTDYDAMTGGWKLFLHNLQLYLIHFKGQPCTAVLVNGIAREPRGASWRALTTSLGLPGSAAPGELVEAVTDGAALAGRVDRVSEGMVTILLDEPGPGIAFFSAEGIGEMTSMSLYLYLFGDDAADVAAKAEPTWRSWMAATFPIPQEQAGWNPAG
jgi:uncharacterized protein YndB with AHSA1/START domain